MLTEPTQADFEVSDWLTWLSPLREAPHCATLSKPVKTGSDLAHTAPRICLRALAIVPLVFYPGQDYRLRDYPLCRRPLRLPGLPPDRAVSPRGAGRAFRRRRVYGRRPGGDLVDLSPKQGKTSRPTVPGIPAGPVRPEAARLAGDGGKAAPSDYGRTPIGCSNSTMRTRRSLAALRSRSMPIVTD